MDKTADKLRKAIREKELSYGELARLTGIPKSALQRYATGTTEKIPIDRVQRIAQALCISAADLMGWDSPAGMDEYGNRMATLDSFRVSEEEMFLIRDYRDAEPVIREAAAQMLRTSAERTRES